MVAQNLSSLFIFACIVVVVRSHNVNNSLIGNPSISCGPDVIEITAQTQNPFEGVLFIKNYRNQPGCYSKYEKFINATNHPTFTISIKDVGRCGLQWNTNPTTNRVELLTTMTVSFHANFITQCDRVFTVFCYYEQPPTTVSSKFNLIPESGLAEEQVVQEINATALVPLVEMKVVGGSVPDPQLPSVNTVVVGDPLTFIWHMTQRSDIYGLRVEECTAETADGRRMTILEAGGCTVDQVIVSDVKYVDAGGSAAESFATTSNWKAFADAMAFKFPDAEDVWLICTVRVCLQPQPHLLLRNGTTTTTTFCPVGAPLCAKRPKRNSAAYSRRDNAVGEEDAAAGLSQAAVMVITSSRIRVLNANDYLHADDKSQIGGGTEDSIEELLPQKGGGNAEESVEGASITTVADINADGVLVSRWCMLKGVFSVATALLATAHLSTIIGAIVLIYYIRKATASGRKVDKSAIRHVDVILSTTNSR